MEKLNRFGKRFTSIFLFCVIICLGCVVFEWCFAKLRDWWFWFPAKVGSDALEWLQAHPPMLILVMCLTFALIFSVLSFIFDDK